MKIRSQKREGNVVTVEVEEDYSAFTVAVDQALSEAGKEVRLPGFRQGKAPREMVEKVLDRPTVEHRAAQNLIADNYPKILDAGKIDPVDYPNIEVVTLEKNQPLVFKVTVEVYPEVKLGKHKGLRVEKKPTAVKEDEVITVLGRLQERFAVKNAEGKLETLPLDDDFAKKVSRYGTLAELKAEVFEALQKEKLAEAEADVRNKLVAAVEADSQVTIPAAMTEREIDIMLDELKTSLAQGGITLEDYLKGTKKEAKTLRDEMRKSAEIRSRGKVVLKAIATAEKMTITPAELEAELKQLATTSGQDVAAVTKGLGEGGQKYVEDYLLRRKALELIVSKATIKEAKEEAKS